MIEKFSTLAEAFRLQRLVRLQLPSPFAEKRHRPCMFVDDQFRYRSDRNIAAREDARPPGGIDPEFASSGLANTSGGRVPAHRLGCNRYLYAPGDEIVHAFLSMLNSDTFPHVTCRRARTRALRGGIDPEFASSWMAKISGGRASSRAGQVAITIVTRPITHRYRDFSMKRASSI